MLFLHPRHCTTGIYKSQVSRILVINLMTQMLTTFIAILSCEYRELRTDHIQRLPFRLQQMMPADDSSFLKDCARSDNRTVKTHFHIRENDFDFRKRSCADSATSLGSPLAFSCWDMFAAARPNPVLFEAVPSQQVQAPDS